MEIHLSPAFYIRLWHLEFMFSSKGKMSSKYVSIFIYVHFQIDKLAPCGPEGPAILPA